MPAADLAATGLHAPASPLEPIAVSEVEAAKLCGLSPKTLSRASNAGQPTGRRKVGQRVIYVVAELRKWIEGAAS